MSAVVLAPLPYHRDVVAYLKACEPELWQWAASADVRAEYAQTLRTDLLKSNYRLDVAGHPELIQRCAAVAETLGITVPITLYQANGQAGMNAVLYHLPGEAHIVFSGPILATLQGVELDAVLAHELAHYRLWDWDGGDFLIADRLLMAAANDSRSEASHAQTARRYRLYTEVFADRGAYTGCGELEATVAALVKTETGLSQVSAVSYLRQADEIFAHDNTATKGIDHPETFIRARALRLWVEQDPQAEIWLAAAIQGPLAVDTLDLAGQHHMTQHTRRLLRQLLRPAWFQTATVLAHARAFFDDFAPADADDDTLIANLCTADAATREYLCFLLLDFAAVDPDLEDLPLAAALTWSAQLDIAEPFEKIAVKELGIGKRPLNKLKKDALALLAKAAAASAKS
jgi:hypothetical protein